MRLLCCNKYHLVHLSEIGCIYSLSFLLKGLKIGYVECDDTATDTPLKML